MSINKERNNRTDDGYKVVSWEVYKTYFSLKKKEGLSTNMMNSAVNRKSTAFSNTLIFFPNCIKEKWWSKILLKNSVSITGVVLIVTKKKETDGEIEQAQVTWRQLNSPQPLVHLITSLHNTLIVQEARGVMNFTRVTQSQVTLSLWSNFGNYLQKMAFTLHITMKDFFFLVLKSSHRRKTHLNYI